ncbi:unnamed protein product [Alopecurus aequalis]
MGDGAADERPKRVVPRLEPIVKHRHEEIASLPIPDELMAEILLLLPTADLARASAACVSLRRVAADRSFLRLYRRLHPPPILGFLEEYKNGRKIFHPAVPPYPSAPEASAASFAADFSFSFLPAPASDWVVQDIRDGRVLLDRRPGHDNTDRYNLVFPETVVCDPLHRHYILLPPIPAHLAATVEHPFWTRQQRYCETFLAPRGDGQEEASAAEETSFRVIWMAQCKTRLIAFVFSSSTGQWRAVPSWRWSEFSAGLPPSTAKSLFYWRHHVYACIYWMHGWMVDDCEESKLLVLNVKTMEFSIAKPPPEANGCCDFAMVEAGEGRLGMFVQADSRSNLNYFIRQNDGGSSSQWQKVKTISIGYSDHLMCNMEKHLLLYKWKRSETGCFMLDTETFQPNKVCTLGSPTYYKLHAYSNFPPSLLSPPTVSSGVGERAEKEMLEQGCAASSSAQSPRSE